MHNHKTICFNLAECEHALFMVWLVRGGFCNGFSQNMPNKEHTRHSGRTCRTPTIILPLTSTSHWSPCSDLFYCFFTVLYNPPGAEWRSWCPSNIATFSGGWSTNMVPKDPEVRSDAYLAILRSWCPPSTDDFTHTYDIEELKFWRAQRPGDRCWNAWPGNDWPVTSCGFLCWMRPFPSFSFIFHISFLINLPF
jgi:hypothetical protein